jgi:hypothetical protein
MSSPLFALRAARVALLLVSAGAALTATSCSDEPAADDPGAGGAGTASSTGVATSVVSSSAVSGPVAASSGVGGASTCEPGSVADLEPHWVPPSALHQGACTPEQAAAFFSQCLDTDCEAFMAEAPECVSCALSYAGRDTTYGAFYGYPELGIGFVNEGGCVAALSGDTSKTGCGAVMQALEDCTIAACGDCPRVGSTEEYSACLDASLTTSCAGYDAASNECFAAVAADNPSVLQCKRAPNERLEGLITRMVTLFCGEGGAGGGGGKADPCPACAHPL